VGELALHDWKQYRRGLRVLRYQVRDHGGGRTLGICIILSLWWFAFAFYFGYPAPAFTYPTVPVDGVALMWRPNPTPSEGGKIFLHKAEYYWHSWIGRNAGT
jgi:hypothetical protein